MPFQPATMSTAQLAAVSYLARDAGRTHTLYSFQLRQWFRWCETNGLDPLVGIQRAHVKLYIRQLGQSGLMDSSLTTMMHAMRGFFRFAHIDGLSGADPAVYARLPKIHRDESRTQGLDRHELIRFLQVAQTLSVHHGALAYLPGIKRAARVRGRRGAHRGLRQHPAGYRVLHPVGKGNKPAWP
jgi:site-specific recombinase XerD